MLTGLLRPSAGDAWIEGVRLSGDLLELKRRIGVLTEELPLYERPTATCCSPRACTGCPCPRPAAARRRSSGSCPLGDNSGKLVVDYSQGMRKKLALACALVHGCRRWCWATAAQRHRPHLGPRGDRPAAAAVRARRHAVLHHPHARRSRGVVRRGGGSRARGASRRARSPRSVRSARAASGPGLREVFLKLVLGQ